MGNALLKQPKTRKMVDTVMAYDAAADSKNRVSLRGAKAKYFHVMALSDGSYLLEPRVLVPPAAIPKRTLQMLEKSVRELKQGRASAPVDLSAFVQD